MTAPSSESDGVGGGNVSNTSSSHESQTPALSYERDLWDGISILNDNTWVRLNFVKNLRTFYNTYKKALEAFSGTLQKANSQFEKDFLKTHASFFTGGDVQEPQMIDTLT